MVIHRWVALLAVPLSALIAGCYMDHFNYVDPHRSSSDLFQCHTLSGYGTVESAGDSITLHPGGVVTVRKFRETFTETSFFVGLHHGDSMRVRIRSTDFDDSVSPGIALTLGKSSSSVQCGQDAPRGIAPTLDDSMTRVQLLTEGARSVIVVGCDTVYAAPSPLPATDAMVFESVKGSDVVIRGLASKSLRIK